MIDKLKKMAREPLLHFLLIGAGIYGLYGMLAVDQTGGDERIVTVTSGEIQSLADQWMKTRMRPPTKLELTSLINDHARTRVLYREAVAMGLDKNDLVHERRLARKLESMTKSLITPQQPSDEVLVDWYTANKASFKQADLYSVTQIFFDPNKREGTTLEDVKATLDKLNSLEHIPSDLGDYGDPIMLKNYYPKLSQDEFGRQFGASFAEKIVKLEPGVWHGPIQSGYGAHLVMLNEVILVPPPAFEQVKNAVTDQWMAQQITELSQRFIAGLLSRYEIIIEDTEVPIAAPGIK